MQRKDCKKVTKVNPVTGKTEVHWVKLKITPNTYYGEWDVLNQRQDPYGNGTYTR